MFAGLFSSTCLLAQNPLLLAPQKPVTYDRRFVIPEFKQINMFTVSSIIAIDEKDSRTEGNLGTGYNYGVGLAYSKAIVNRDYCGIFLGLGYEYYPSQFQKAKVFLEYKSPVFFNLIDIFPKYEFLWGWDLKSNRMEKQNRIYFINLRAKSSNLNFGIQSYDESFDNGFFIFELTYNFYPKKW